MSVSVRGVAVAMTLATLVACGGGGGGNAQDKPPPSPLGVNLKEFSLTPGKTSVAAGRIRFFAQNAGTVKHMLVVLRSDLAPDRLPVDGDVVDVDGSGVKLIGSIDQFDAGTISRKVMTLEAGAHVLICNVPSHYQQGMRAALSVT